MNNPLYRVTFTSPTLGRRISLATALGLKDSYYDVTFLATAIQLIAKYPDDYPCPQVETFFDLRSDSVVPRERTDLESLYVVKSSIPFKFPKI